VRKTHVQSLNLLYLTPPPQLNPREYPPILYISRNYRIIRLHFAVNSITALCVASRDKNSDHKPKCRAYSGHIDKPTGSRLSYPNQFLQSATTINSICNKNFTARCYAVCRARLCHSMSSVCPSVTVPDSNARWLRLTVHRDCLTRSSNTRKFSQLSFCVLFITAIRLTVKLAVNNGDGSNWVWLCDVLVLR